MQGDGRSCRSSLLQRPGEPSRAVLWPTPSHRPRILQSLLLAYLMPHDHAHSHQHAHHHSIHQRVPALSTAPLPGFVRGRVCPHRACCCSSLSGDVSRRMNRWMLAAAGPTASFWMSKVPLWVEIWRNCCRVSLVSRCVCMLLLTISLLPDFSRLPCINVEFLGFASRSRGGQSLRCG